MSDPEPSSAFNEDDYKTNWGFEDDREKSAGSTSTADRAASAESTGSKRAGDDWFGDKPVDYGAVEENKDSLSSSSEDDEDEEDEEEEEEEEIDKSNFTFWEHTKDHVTRYFQETTVHGFRYVVEGVNIYERGLWMIFITCAITYAGTLINVSLDENKVNSQLHGSGSTLTHKGITKQSSVDKS